MKTFTDSRGVEWRYLAGHVQVNYLGKHWQQLDKLPFSFALNAERVRGLYGLLPPETQGEGKE